MSLFGRIIARAALPGQPVPPLALPKGMTMARAPAQMPDEDETAAPLARAAAPGEDQAKLALLRREAAGDAMEDLPRLRRAADPKAEGEDEPQDKAAPLRRAAKQPSEDEMAQPMRRAAEPSTDDEKAQPLHRAATGTPPEPEEKARPMRRLAAPLHRFPVLPSLILRVAPQAETLTADNSPMPADASGEPDNERAMTLRRDAGLPGAAPGFSAVPTGPAFDPPPPATPAEFAPEVFADAPPHLRQAFEPERPAYPQPQPDWPAFEPAAQRPQPQTTERPRVVIEQIDVAITDSGSAGHGQMDFAATLTRALRSRYLGG